MVPVAKHSMKVLQTINSLSPYLGGPSSCTFDLMQGFASIGANVDLLTLKSKLPKVDNLGHGCSWLHEVDNDSWGPLVFSNNLRKALLKSDYDVYHANTLWLYPSHITCKVAREKGRPYVLSPHGMLYPNAIIGKSSWKKKLVLPLFQRKDLELATVLHATCEQEMGHLRNLGFKQPIAIVPNCLNIDAEYLKKSGEKRPENSRRRFGFVGRVARIKNIDRIIAAWGKLGDKTKDSELVIIGAGDDEYMTELKRYVIDHNLKNVSFTGFLKGDALKAEVHKLDIQLLVSTSENFGMVVPEALINRVPVIAGWGTPWGELPEKSCGWWIDNSTDSIAETIDQALQLPESKRYEMGENGRRLVLEKYSMENVARMMMAVYDYILGTGTKTNDIYE